MKRAFIDIFPLTITFRRRIDTIQQVRSEILIDAIQAELIRLKVDQIRTDGLRIYFKNSFFNGQGRGHLMAAVDKGYFELNKASGELIYVFSTMRSFLIGLAISLFMYLISRNLSFLFFLIWMIGFGSVIDWIRHYFFMNRLKKMLLKL
jgi:hypothetical protein